MNEKPTIMQHIKYAFVCDTIRDRIENLTSGIAFMDDLTQEQRGRLLVFDNVFDDMWQYFTENNTEFFNGLDDLVEEGGSLYDELKALYELVNGKKWE